MVKEFPDRFELDLLLGELVGINGEDIKQTHFTSLEKELFSTCAPCIKLGGKLYSRTEYIAKIHDNSILKRVVYEIVSPVKESIGLFGHSSFEHTGLDGG